MHLSEGIVTATVLAGGTTAAAAGLVVGLKQLKPERIPRVAVLSSAFFVASLIHIPMGPVSVHLVLNGINGLVLGWAAFPSIFVALTFQMLLFQFGGITVLGLNTLIMAFPAVIVQMGFGRIVRGRSNNLALVGGFLAGSLSVLMGGRISEELFLNTMTTGAGSDFERATSIARKMVCEWGMSALGPLSYGKKDDLIFLGRDMMSHSEYSEETAKKIDDEVAKIIDRAYENSKQIISNNRDKLEKIAQLLLEKESLSSDDIAKIVGKINKNKNMGKKVSTTKQGAGKAKV